MFAGITLLMGYLIGWPTWALWCAPVGSGLLGAACYKPLEVLCLLREAFAPKRMRDGVMVYAFWAIPLLIGLAVYAAPIFVIFMLCKPLYAPEGRDIPTWLIAMESVVCAISTYSFASVLHWHVDDSRALRRPIFSRIPTCLKNLYVSPQELLEPMIPMSCAERVRFVTKSGCSVNTWLVIGLLLWSVDLPLYIIIQSGTPKRLCAFFGTMLGTACGVAVHLACPFLPSIAVIIVGIIAAASISVGIFRASETLAIPKEMHTTA